MRTVPLHEVAQINPRWPISLEADSLIDFVGMADVNDLTAAVQASETRSVSDTRTGYTPFERGDVLIAKITPCFQNNKIAQANIGAEFGAGSTEFHVVRPGPELDARFLLHFLRRPEFRELGEMRMTGSGGQRRVPVNYVRETSIPLPPLDEQRRIADILDRAQVLVEHFRRSRELCDSLVIQAAQPLFRSTPASPTLNDLGVRFTSGRNVVATGIGAHESNRVLKVSAVSSGSFRSEETKPMPADYSPPPSHLVHRGDILVTRASGSKHLIGLAVTVDDIEADTFLPDKIWRAELPRDFSPEFFMALTRSSAFRAYIENVASGAAGVSNVSQKNFLDFRIELPAQTQMEALGLVVKRARAQAQKLDTAIRGGLGLQSALANRAFKGEL